MKPEEKWNKLKRALDYPLSRYAERWKDGNAYDHGRYDAYDEMRFWIWRLENDIEI